MIVFCLQAGRLHLPAVCGILSLMSFCCRKGAWSGCHGQTRLAMPGFLAVSEHAHASVGMAPDFPQQKLMNAIAFPV